MTVGAPPVEAQLEQLTAQVAELTEELRQQRLDRERWAELATDLTPIAGDALHRLSDELDALGITGDDLVGLLRTLAAALPDLQAALRQLSGAADLVRTAAPLAGPALEGLTDRLAELEARGYVEFAVGGIGVVDKVVGSFTREDVDALGDNIVLILNTVKEMTQPEVMAMLRRTLHTVQEPEGVEPPSVLAIARQLRDPQVRRGLERVLNMLRSVGEEPAGTAQ